jgi:hypothetical protein
MPRRAAFYFRRAAQLYAEMYQWRAAHQIFLLAAHAYRLQIFTDERAEGQSPSSSSSSSSRSTAFTASGGVRTTADGRNQSIDACVGGASAWPALRRALLLDLIHAAHGAQDAACAGRYAARLLHWGAAVAVRHASLHATPVQKASASASVLSSAGEVEKGQGPSQQPQPQPLNMTTRGDEASAVTTRAEAAASIVSIVSDANSSESSSNLTAGAVSAYSSDGQRVLHTAAAATDASGHAPVEDEWYGSTKHSRIIFMPHNCQVSSASTHKFYRYRYSV